MKEETYVVAGLLAYVHGLRGRRCLGEEQAGGA
jgi:hypothetical protein